jgi:N-acetylmuramoyl-L-alanine amidase
MLTIVIDPGHGGRVKVGGSSPNNATGPKGTLEKSVTLAIALAAKSALPSTDTVILTRDYDINIGLADRANVALINSADLFLSIHLNGWHSPSVQGTECYHHPSANMQSQDFAQLIQTEILAITGIRDRGVKSQNMGVLRPSRHHGSTGACLVEISFLTDPDEEIRINNKLYIDRLGQAIARACQAYTPGAYDSFVMPQARVQRRRDEGDAEEFEDGLSMQSQARRKGGVSNGLQSIKGIGPAREQALLDMNVKSLTDLVQMPKSTVDECAEALGVGIKTIEAWIVQTKSKI